MEFIEQLKGGNIRSLGRVKRVISQIASQSDFDELIKGLFHEDRVVQMRAVDAVEKITKEAHREYLVRHKKRFLYLLNRAETKQFKWHLALIIPRLELSEREALITWDQLTGWALNKKESRIVRANSIQGLFDITQVYPELKQDLESTFQELEQQRIPSVRARIRKLRKKL